MSKYLIQIEIDSENLQWFLSDPGGEARFARTIKDIAGAVEYALLGHVDAGSYGFMVSKALAYSPAPEGFELPDEEEVPA